MVSASVGCSRPSSRPLLRQALVSRSRSQGASTCQTLREADLGEAQETSALPDAFEAKSTFLGARPHYKWLRNVLAQDVFLAPLPVELHTAP